MDRERFKVFQERLKTDKDFAEKWSRCNSQKDQKALLEATGLELPPGNFDGGARKLSEEDLAKVAGGDTWDTCVETGVLCQFLSRGEHAGFNCSTYPHEPSGIVPFQ
jgi:predicted ribosomally synthesized peptide with nif11-like leader